jgi:methylornithine synthase
MTLDEILVKSIEEKKLLKDEIDFLLEQTEEDSLDKIFSTARKLREKYFEAKVFLYGFVYFSTYCKNNCNFCFYRCSNDKPPRYRKSINEILTISKKLQDSGIHLIDLTMGEDPYFLDYPDRLVEIVRKVKDETNLPVMVSPGVVNNEVIDSLIDAGADWYALYQETHNEELYSSLRSDQDYSERLAAKKYARNKGLLIEEGLLVGIGNSTLDTVESLSVMEELKASQVRTMTFIPQDGTPMANNNQRSFLSELLNIAIMRIVFPNLLIPASLDVDGLNGLEDRLNAGANVITSIIPPDDGYAGVANASCDIDEGFRTIEGIQDTLKKCGLKQANVEEYKTWVINRKEMGNVKIENINYRGETTGLRSCLSS